MSENWANPILFWSALFLVGLLIIRFLLDLKLPPKDEDIPDRGELLTLWPRVKSGDRGVAALWLRGQIYYRAREQGFSKDKALHMAREPDIDHVRLRVVEVD